MIENLPEVRRVLVVDDCPVIGDLFRSILSKTDEDASVSFVENCQQAIGFIRREACDLILLDQVLVGETGLGCLSEIRRIKPELPVVILTETYDRQTMRACYEAGADDYLIKENAERYLPHVVFSAIERRRNKVEVKQQTLRNLRLLEELKVKAS